MTKQQIAYIAVPTLLFALIGSLFLLTPLHGAKAGNGDYEVTIQNISNAILTPPIIALTRRNNAEFFELGESANNALEQLAEGGATGDLKMFFESKNASVATHNAPLMPGTSVTLNVSGKRGFLYLASMLLPTNDGFAGLNGVKVKGRETVFYARAYDAGTENNSELDADIPGPFGGEGFNSDRDDVDLVFPHAGLHGEGDQSMKEYNWSDPVVKVTIKRI